jgi:hypothetical protein
MAFESTTVLAGATWTPKAFRRNEVHPGSIEIELERRVSPTLRETTRFTLSPRDLDRLDVVRGIQIPREADRTPPSAS